MSQKNRVLASLHKHRKHGISQIDFDLPDVIDGGAPIKRVAARIEELRDEGFAIRSGERRQKCIVYRLVPEANAPTAIDPSTRRAGAEGSGVTQQAASATKKADASPVSRPAPKTLFDTAPANAILGDAA